MILIFISLDIADRNIKKIVSDPITPLIHKDDLGEVSKIQKRFLSSGEDENCEYRIVNKEGHIVWIKLNLTMISVEGRRYSFASFMDVSKEKELSDRMELISDNVSSSISVIKVSNKKPQLIFANQAFSRITGCSREQYMHDTEKYYKEEVDSANLKRMNICWFLLRMILQKSTRLSRHFCQRGICTKES